ncbi:hypothetical protein [Micromonospora sp. KC213]|uniref:hypothetical protein n=1 Tax=Micromonospora sp. KC213 TaxID=2530378 RepID=UPI00104510DE|nr:hypothetical protein [Micromonospora sp. KC213]TDC42912.1 hypothetical protein E1166_05735 [Micromonospora sp. KC213]
MAHRYALHRYRRGGQVRDVTGLAAATFVEPSTPPVTMLAAYDGNLRVEAMWLGSRRDDPQDVQRRLVAVADSIVARL